MLRNQIQAIETHEGFEGSSGPAERRRILRVRSYFPVLLEPSSSEEGEAFRATVTDLGVEGLRFKTSQFVPTSGQSVLVHWAAPHPDFGGVNCHIMWVKAERRDTVVGCRYADTKENMLRSWVRYVLQELGFDENCIYQRRRMAGPKAIPARVSHNGEHPLPDAKVTSLGVGGALVESRYELGRGAQVDMEMSLWRILPTLALPAQVLDVREDPATRTFLHSMQFGALHRQQIRLLGNYVINQLNQLSA